jgi:hypothetical protein
LDGLIDFRRSAKLLVAFDKKSGRIAVKPLVVVLLALVALLNAGQAQARHFSSRSCDLFLAHCKARTPEKAAGCQILFDAAGKSGGAWGQPEARAAAHIPGHVAFCEP